MSSGRSSYETDTRSAPPKLPTEAVFTGLFDPDGTEVWLSSSRLEEKTEIGPEVYVPPGKIEAPTSGRMSFEITSTSIVKDAFVDVWNDVENTHYRMGAPTYIGYVRQQGPWFFVDIWHEYIGNKRVFTVYLQNWSHTFGRRFQLHLTYESGTRAKVVRRENGTRS